MYNKLKTNSSDETWFFDKSQASIVELWAPKNRPDKLIHLAPEFYIETLSGLSSSFHPQSGISARFRWACKHFMGARIFFTEVKTIIQFQLL